MDSFEWNKIAGAVLGTLIFVLVVKFTTEAVFEVPKPAKPGYVVEGVTEEASTSTIAAPAEEVIPDWGTVLPRPTRQQARKSPRAANSAMTCRKGARTRLARICGVCSDARAARIRDSLIPAR
ncbi:MAG: hypothetical protein WDM89_04065 [Rhizomicrobium sp.]